MSRSTSNALRVHLVTPNGNELARAQRKGGAAVLFGFKNGGKGDYKLSSSSGDELRIAVSGTTTITRQNTPSLCLPTAPHDSKTAAATCSQWYCRESRADSAWHHRILSPAGQDLGVLTLMTVHTGWSDIEAEAVQLLANHDVAGLKAPSGGARLKLGAPVVPALGDVLAAACVDFSVLPRGYLA